ncbi:hypothetical protein Tco_1499687 [Tanacetum coccineum]
MLTLRRDTLLKSSRSFLTSLFNSIGCNWLHDVPHRRVIVQKVQRTWLKCGVLSGFTGKPAHNRNTSAARKENMPYPRFTKAIISKDKSISMRNKLFMHTVQHDSILGYLKFVSKTDDYQAYGALIPAKMTSLKIRNSPAYKSFLAYATGAIPPKKARKFKKPAFSSKKKTLVAVEEPVKKLPRTAAEERVPLVFQIGDNSWCVCVKEEGTDKG